MRPLPSLRQLRYLVALAETRHFTRAAESCFVSQSTLSAGLKELEQILGVTLVERDRQSVALTPIGAEIAARGRALLAAAEDLAETAAAAAAPMSGALRIGMIPTIAPFVLPALLARLGRAHPRLRPALREDLTANLLARLAAGGLDCALIALPYDTAGLLLRRLYDDPLLLVARPDDPVVADPRPIALGDAEIARLLLLEEGHCLRAHTLEACARGRGAPPAGIEATSLPTLVRMVEAGLGLALLPALAIAGGALAGTALVARALASPAPSRGLALVARRSTARRAAFDALADAILALRPAAAAAFPAGSGLG
jgi:LysR family hydrogen peroxide-inducible transcriptional activator